MCLRHPLRRSTIKTRAILAPALRRPTRGGKALRWLHMRAFAFAPERISVVAGLRGAAAVVLAVAAAVYFRQPELAWAAFAAFWTCLADPGGARRLRLRVMGGFAFCGAVVAGLVAALSATGPCVIAATLFALVGASTFTSLRRARTAAPGTLVSVTAVVAVEQPSALIDAPLVSVTFLSGGALAILLSLALSSPVSAPARRAVALVLDALRDMAAELACGADGLRSPEKLQSEHRRSVRHAIEQAREQLDNAAAFPPGCAETNELYRVLDSTDQIFAGLIALSHGWDHRPSDQSTRRRDLLHGLDAALAEVAKRVRKPQTSSTALRRAAERLRAAVAADALLTRVAKTWRTALDRLVEPPPVEGRKVRADKRVSPGPGTTNGEAATHALRRAAVVLLTYEIGHRLSLPYVHWTPMAAVVVTHPDATLSWRMIERILGSVAGGLAAAPLAAVLDQSWEEVAIVLPLAAATLALRSVNYTLFVLFLTPLFVLAATLFSPGTGEAVAAARTTDNVLGSILAMLGCLLLWPRSPFRAFSGKFVRAVDANLHYARAVTAPDSTADAIDAARKWAGSCSTAAEHALLRMPFSGGRARGRLAEARGLLAALRRVAGAAAAVQVASDPGAAEQLGPMLTEVRKKYQAYAAVAELARR